MLDEFDNYQESILGFVLDVTLNYVEEGKKAITDVIQNHTDLAYVYARDKVEVPPRKGMAVGHLLNQKHDEVFNLGVAIRHSLSVLKENENVKLLVITSRYKVARDRYRCMKAISFDRERSVDLYFFCLDGVEKDIDLPHIQKIKVENLAKDMVAVVDPDYEWPVEEVVEKVEKVEVKKKKKPVEKKEKNPPETINPGKIDWEDLSDE